MEYTERTLINQCIRKIEQKFFPELKDGGKLKQRDLEYLIEMIEKQSEIKLSLSTMKRLWKDDFNKLPHTNTLDALVSLLGYNSWGEYRQSHQSTQSDELAIRSKALVKYSLIALGIAILIGFIYFQFNQPKPLKIPQGVQFSADKTVTNGVPNTVIFSYNVSEVNADSFFIQRSWNPANKNQIDPKRQFFSETYYYPGFHWASLIANETVIKKIRINIQTEGWMATSKSKRLSSVPAYLNQAPLTQDGIMQITDQNFEASGFNPKEGLVLSYANVSEFSDLSSDAFILETRLKFESTKAIVCPFAEIRVIDEKDASWFTITDKGCVGNLYLKVGDNLLEGPENDFSKLGANMSEWQSIRLVNQDENLKFYLNNELVLETPFTGAEGKIKGIILTFNGRGMVDYFRLKDVNENPVYQDEF